MVRYMILSVALGLAFASCASFAFNYRYYGLDLEKEALLGPEPQLDQPLTICAPGPEAQFPCVVLKEAEFFRLKGDYAEIQERLKACERGLFIGRLGQ
jgi:hypothetical protein